MDPLTLVRDFNLNNRLEQIRQHGEQVDFGGMYMFPKTTRTAFVPQSGTPCTLEAVLFVLKTRHILQPAYLKAAQAERLEFLSFIDRTKLLDVLDGKAQLEMSTMGVAQLPEAQHLQDSEPAAKKARLEDGAEGAVVEQVRFQRQLRDRNTMLLATSGKDFKRVLDIASSALMELSTMLKQQQHLQLAVKQPQAAPQPHQRHPVPDKPRPERPAPTQPKPAPPAAGAAPKPSSRFDRDNVTGQLKAFGGEATALDMYGFAGSAQETGGAAEGGTQPLAPKERPPSSSSKPPAPGSSSQSRPPHSSSAHKPSHASSHSQRPPHSSSQARPPASAAKPADKANKEDRIPIILVPSGMTAMVNMYNARTFLAEGRYEPSAQVQASGQPKPTEVRFERTAGKPVGKGVTYIVTDKPPDKTDEAKWQRVVAVIVSGAKWQFKDWPIQGGLDGNMLETFANIAGYYIHFSDDKVPETVANWNVKRLGLAREKRHMDTPVMLDFYRHLDAFLAAKKSMLNY